MNTSNVAGQHEDPSPHTHESFGVVVLNYNDYESSIGCVNSILECDPLPLKIVVVDNDSPNESFSELRNAFPNTSIVDVVASGHNGGYSFGNNVGIRRLRQLGCKHVVIATSDTEVVSRDLLARLASAIDETTGVIAPQIVTDVGNENPSVEELSFRYLVDLAWVRHGMPGLRLRRAISRFVRHLLPSRSAARQNAPERPPSGQDTVRRVYKLHGAFLCLTDTFLTRIGELDEGIFMFGEEDLLAWLCLDNGLTQTLLPDVIVRHAHDSSVNMTWGTDAQKFVDIQAKKSGRALLHKIDMGQLWRAWMRSLFDGVARRGF